MPSTVLVPVDGSNFAEHALPYALTIARQAGASLHLALVHVPAEAVGPTYPLSEEIQAHYEEQRTFESEYLEGLVERLAPSGVTPLPALLSGRVTQALEDYVDEQSIDLVVMTTHGRGGLQRAWLGSTADSLIRHCMIPILLVRPSEDTREIGPDRVPKLMRVVIALDGSETSEVALKDALALRVTDGARLHLVHVLQPAVASASPYLPHTIQLTHDEMSAREAHMKRYLDRIADGIEGHDCEIHVEVDYHPAPAVLDLAERVDADLIVLGTHGRGGLRRLILGSVADKVIRGTDRPVLVHRGVGRIARLTHGRNSHPASAADTSAT